MSGNEVVKLLGREIEKAGSLRELSRRWSVSAPYLSDVINGNRSPGPAILKHLGLRKAEHYEPVKPGR